VTELKLSLLFEGIDRVTNVARSISSAVTGTGRSALQAARASGPLTKLTGDVAQLGVQLRGISNEQDGLDQTFKKLKGIGDQLQQIGRAGISAAGRGLGGLGKMAAKVPGAVSSATGGYGTIATAVGGGFAAKEILGDNEFFNRLRINSGASIEEIDKLREHLLSTARVARIPTDELKEAFDALRAGGAPLEFIDKNLDVVGAAIQRLNGHGADLGELFANLRKFDDLQGPQELLQAIATLNLQLKGIPGGLEAFSEATAPLLAQYREMGHSGLQAIKEIGAVYATIAPGTATPRQARTATENVLGLVSNRESGRQLQSMGVSVYGHTNEEAEKNFQAGKTLPLTEILQSLLKQYLKDPAVFDQVLGPTFRQDFKIPLAETKEKGFSPTLNSKLSETGDPQKFLAQAAESSLGLQGSLNSLSATLKQVGENILSTPFQWLADTLDKCQWAATGLVIAVGGLGVLGTVGGIIGTVNKGLLQFGINLPGAVRWTAGWAVRAWALIPSLSGVAVGLAAASETAAGWLAFSPALSAMFTMLSEGFLSVGLAIEATPIGWIITGIALVAAAAYLIYENWTPIKAFFGKLWNDVVQIFGGVWDIVAGLVTGDSERASKGITTVWSGIKSFFGDLWKGLFEDSPIGYIIAPWIAPIVVIVAHWSAISTWFSGLWTSIETIAQGALKVFVGLFTGDMGTAVDGLKEMWQGFADFFSKIWQGAVDTAQWAIDKISSIGDLLPDWMKGDDSKKPGTPGAVVGMKKMGAGLGPQALPSVGAPAVPVIQAPISQALAQAGIPTMPLPANANIPAPGQSARAGGQDKRSGATSDLMQYFESQGWSHAQASGLVSNFTVESGLRPNAVGDGGSAYGLGQWHPDRQAAFASMFGKDIRSSSLLEQAAFANYELTQGNEQHAGQALKGAKSAYDAGAIISSLYERPADREGNMAIRGGLAQQLATLQMPAGVPAPTLAATVAAPAPGANVATLGPTLGAPVPPLAAQPVTQTASAANGNGQKGEIVVRFENAPAGMRVDTKKSPAGVTLSVDVGYAMATP
jgi:Phage tail lysozyme